jgi:maltooligosyltrehalose trehalohydrolase
MRVATALHLLLPQSPLLFQGQEFFASSPFQYFTEHDPELGRLVTEGRTREFAAFLTSDQTIPDPQSPETFERSKLDWQETSTYPGLQGLALHQELLQLRKTDPVLAQSRSGRAPLQAWAQDNVVVVIVENDIGVRAILANFGEQESMARLPGGRWAELFSTATLDVGGTGTHIGLLNGAVQLPPLTACVVRPQGQ